MTKKQLIIQAAIELFAEKGIESTSVQQITDKCGISKGAFYLIFKSKEELILAIIDHFMIEFNIIIDQSVKMQKSSDDMLYQYYLTSLNFFNEHKALALIFLREHLSSLSEDVFNKLFYYDTLGTHFLSDFLDEIYGEKVETTKYDLIVMMNSMLTGYINKLLFTNIDINLEKLATMLVEKTNILAEYSTQHVLEFYDASYSPQEIITTHTLLTELEALKFEVNAPIELQSIEMLFEEINRENPNLALILGVAHNLTSTPRGNWIAKLIENFYKVKKQ